MTQSPPPPAEVRLTGVAKRYGKVEAVKPVDLVIEPGSLVTLLGPSGCGKTTLLRMIAGLERVSEGRLFIGGRDVTDLSAGERNVSMVFQSYALFPHMNVRDNVAYGLVSGGMSRSDAHARAAETLATVGLSGFGDRLPSEMSGGQQQRVAVARALVLEPAVLLFDEPLSNLDARLRRSMREEIRALQQRLGVTVVYVTHDQSEALAVSDKIVVMHNAGIAQMGTPADLYARPESVFVATFMGEANHLKGVVTEVAGAEAALQLDVLTLRVPHRGHGNGPVDVVIRPEAIRLRRAGESGLPGRVTKATYMGSHTEYTVATALGDLFLISPDRLERHSAGTEVAIQVDPAGAALVRP